jgi:hypothetical protein
VRQFLHPQLHQFINLFLLLLLAKYSAFVYLSWLEIVYVLVGTLCMELFFIFLKKSRHAFFPYSALTTAIGVMLMMVTPHLYLYFTVIAFALIQKHFFQYYNKHFFNPSNFALIFALLFFYNDAHLVLGQLGDSLWIRYSIIVFAIVILYRVKRWIIAISFPFFYLFLQYIFVIDYDPMLLLEDVYYRFYSLSFVLFILFMLTDPKTTPSRSLDQILFSFMVALISVYLDRVNGFRVQHLFMALFILSPFVKIVHLCMDEKDKKQLLYLLFAILLLSLSAIIYIEMQAPYYFEMDG